MPTKTPNFGLKAFVAGDTYSASIDRERFFIVDQHMAFITDIVGYGTIEGWTISQPDPGDLKIKVDAGWGIVGRDVTRTFGASTVSLLDNNLVYVWIRKRPGVIGEAGPFSDIVSFNHTDSIAPSTPSPPFSVQTTTNSVSLQWSFVADIDIDRYVLQRSLDDSFFTTIEETPSNSYLDMDLNDNTTYYYRLQAIDKSGNSSGFSSSFTVTTDPDLSQPLDPTAFDLTPSRESIHALWRPSLDEMTDLYRLQINKVDISGSPISPDIFVDVDSETFNYSFTGLDNGSRYRIIIKSVSSNGVESGGIDAFATPRDLGGPKDVLDVQVSNIPDPQSSFNQGTILRVSWTPSFDPYDPYSDDIIAHEIRITEIDSSTGTAIVSEWQRESVNNSKDIKLFAFENDNGVVVNKSISVRTTYLVTVRAVDANGNVSSGVTTRIVTKSFDPPFPVSRLIANQQLDQSLRFEWIPSPSVTKFHVINLISYPADNPSQIRQIQENLQVGKISSFVMPPSFIESNTVYEFSIYAEDEFGNQSSVISAEYVVPDADSIPRPKAPNQVFTLANDSQITVSWNIPRNTIASGFCIYRTEQRPSYNSSNFIKVETVPADVFSFIDYDVQNGTTYAYFVTTLDLYGNESLNPIQDDFFDYNLSLSTPVRSGNLGKAENIQTFKSGDDVSVTWDPTGGDFDGYEIYKSIGNKYSFRYVDSVSSSELSYLDEDALVESDIYYYMIRKYKDEADVFITESSSVVSDALLIGVVETNSGSMDIDQSVMRRIKDLEDTVREETRERVEVHKHIYISEEDDRRINLSTSILVDDWFTVDFQSYTTLEDLQDVLSFEVLINGEKTNIPYSVNREASRITFERRLFRGNLPDDDGIFYPFDEPPVIEVKFFGLSEVSESSKLFTDRVDDLSATQISTGFIDKKLLPNYSHEGRLNEQLLPVRNESLTYDDGYSFEIVLGDGESGTTAGSRKPNATVWYELYKINKGESEFLLGGNSKSIYVSEDLGATWRKLFRPATPVREFFRSEEYNVNFALTNRGILANAFSSEDIESLSFWQEVPGMENAKIARGITEAPNMTNPDDPSVIFATGDIGVFKLQRDIGRAFYFWEQTPIFGPRSTEAYDIIYDHVRERVIVSNELGIFETTNDGFLWTFSDEFPDQRPIFQFTFYNDSLFAITDGIVWRRNPGDAFFQRIKTFETVDLIRKIKIWRNRLYISTDQGLLVSYPGSDLINDDNIEFDFAFPSINEGNYVPPVTSLNIVEDRMFVGTESRLYVADAPGNLKLHWEESGKIIPTFYIDDQPQKIGVRFNALPADSTGPELPKFFFDVKQKGGSKVDAAIQYRIYEAENGGWAGANFQAPVNIIMNGSLINDVSVPSRPYSSLVSRVSCLLNTPHYNDRNANKRTADAALSKAENILRSIDQSDESTYTIETINSFISTMEYFKSQLYEEKRIIDDSPCGSGIDIIPPFAVLLLASQETFNNNSIASHGLYSSFRNDLLSDQVNAPNLNLPGAGDGDDGDDGGAGDGSQGFGGFGGS